MQSLNESTAQCREILSKHLSPPPYDSTDFFESITKRIILPFEEIWTKHVIGQSRNGSYVVTNPEVGSQASADALYNAIKLSLLLAAVAMLCGALLLISSRVKKKCLRRITRSIVGSQAVKIDHPSILILEPNGQQPGIRWRPGTRLERPKKMRLELEPESTTENKLKIETQREQKPEQNLEYNQENEEGINLNHHVDESEANLSEYHAMRLVMQRGISLASRPF